jgi:hypothetical protein
MTARNSSRNPYVFIVGSPRSGTTLLARMVDAHPSIAVIHELQWIPRFFEKRRGLTSSGSVTPKIIPKLLENRRFARLKAGRAELEELIGAGGAAYASFVSALFDRYGEMERKSLVGEKTPAYGRSLPTLHALWPRTRYIHVIRDGRDVSLSMVTWGKASRAAGRFARAWHRDPVITTALFWEWNVRLALEAAATFGPGLYHEVRYEAFVADPAGECAELCTFLDLPFDDAMLRSHEGRTRPDPVLEGDQVWLPVTSGLRDWRTQMSRDDVERFEAAAGQLLDELGYPRGAPDPSPEALEEAAAVRRLFAADAAARKVRLPERWSR